MTTYTEHVLAAFHLAVHRVNAGPDVEVLDISVADAGDALFGVGWTPVKHGRSVAYAPLVSMALGRMRVEGLVRMIEVAESYRSWAFTAKGRTLAEETFGPAAHLVEPAQ